MYIYILHKYIYIYIYIYTHTFFSLRPFETVFAARREEFEDAQTQPAKSLPMMSVYVDTVISVQIFRNSSSISTSVPSGKEWMDNYDKHKKVGSSIKTSNTLKPHLKP